MKKILFILLTIILPTNVFGVLKEKTLGQSLKVLQAELSSNYVRQKQMMARLEAVNAAQHEQMMSLMQRSGQISLMLYSQKSDWLFGLTYACEQATRQFWEFHSQRMPYDRIHHSIATEVERYNGLIISLESLPPALNYRIPPTAKANNGQKRSFANQLKLEADSVNGEPIMLSADEQQVRNRCLLFAKALHNNLQRIQFSISADSVHYAATEKHLSTLNDYAKERYSDIQQSIFQNSGFTYLDILKHLPFYLTSMKSDLIEKYTTTGLYSNVKSEWSGKVIWRFVCFVISYLILALILGFTIVNITLRHRRIRKNAEFQKKKSCLIAAAGALFFAVSIMIARSFISHDFYKMASNLLIEYAWLLVAIFVSLLIRVDGDKIKNCFKVYAPTLLLGLIVIIMRIAFVPNTFINVLYPVIIAVLTALEWIAIKHNKDNVPRSDNTYIWISFFIMVFSFLISLVGYTMLAVVVFSWWLFQLTAIQAIICVYSLLGRYESLILERRLSNYRKEHKKIETSTKNGEYFSVTWFFDIVQQAIVPIASVFSILYCIYLTADMFNLSETCIQFFIHPFVNIPGVIRLSLFNIVVIAAAYFVSRYVCYALKAIYRYWHLGRAARKKDGIRVIIRKNEVNLTLGYNIITILTWGFYIICVILLLHIPKSGISIVTAGLATGIGFAMKDLINNFFYGLSLMTGRLRVGDWIECDGIQGRVDSIGYQSTQIITLDDCVMSFLNSTLFSKNFKNLTRNHPYELLKISVGVAYGQNVEHVRELLSTELMKTQKNDKYGRPIIDPKHGVLVIFDSFGDNSVNLIVAMWVLVAEKVIFIAKAKETIYNTLTENHIEIPFPQRDVYIRELPKSLTSGTTAPSSDKK